MVWAFGEGARMSCPRQIVLFDFSHRLLRGVKNHSGVAMQGMPTILKRINVPMFSVFFLLQQQ